MYAIPNAGRRSLRAAAWMKAEGLRAGVPDVHLPVPRGRYAGLWIEHKSAGGRLTDAQHEWIRRLTAHGHLVVVSRSLDESIAAITRYLRPPL